MSQKTLWDEAAQHLPAELREQFLETMSHATRSEAPEANPAYARMRQRAALSGSFDPVALVPAAVADTASLLQRLYAESTVSVEGGRRLWILNEGPRREELSALDPDKVRALLPARPAADDLTRMLTGYLTGSAPALERQKPEELVKTAMISEWLAGTSFSSPPPAEVTARLGFVQLLKPFDELLIGGFSGRDRELAELAEFVGATAPRGWVYAGRRVLNSALRKVVGSSSDRPFIVHSPGGMGKSTLMAKFLVEHARQPKNNRFPFAYLDFDRATLRPRQPLSVLNEIARQVGYQFPALREELSLIAVQQREQLDRLVAESRGGRQSVEDGLSDSAGRDPRLLEDSCRRLRDAIHRVLEKDRVFLIVFDTFEEVQQVDKDEVEWALNVVRVLSEGGRWAALRFVVSSRAPLEGVEDAGHLALGELDPEAAVQMLGRAIKAPYDAVPTQMLLRVHKQVGGSPLALKLAGALLCAALEESSEEMSETVSSFATLDRTRLDRFLGRWNSEHVSAQLYKRILDHIKDAEISKLAHPGLVLRRITPGLISKFLAIACGLGPVDPTRERDLFDRLARQVSLVTRTDDVLTHRSDLRSLMLGLIREDLEQKKRGSFAELNNAAAEFLHHRGPDQDPIEALYHCLLAGNLERATRFWTRESGPALRVTLEELPPPAQAFVRAKRLADLSQTEIELLDGKTWTLHAEERAERLLVEQKPAEVHRLLSRRKLIGDTVGQARLRAAALAGMGELRDAHDQFDYGARLSKGSILERAQLFRDFGELLLRSGDKRAVSVYEEALQITREADDPLAELECLTGRLGALRRAGVKETSRESTEMFELINRLGSLVGARAPDLLRRAVLFADRALRGDTPLRSTFLEYLRVSPVRTLNQSERAILEVLVKGTSQFAIPVMELISLTDSALRQERPLVAVALEDLKGSAVQDLGRFLTTILDAGPLAAVERVLELLTVRHVGWRLPAQHQLLNGDSGKRNELALTFIERKHYDGYLQATPDQQVRQLVDQADECGRLVELLQKAIPKRPFTRTLLGWDGFLRSLVPTGRGEGP